MSEKIECESVTVQVPKAIMEFLRSIEKPISMTAKEYIEYNIVECVRADIDAWETFISPKEVAEGWGLNPIFKTIINDEVKY